MTTTIVRKKEKPGMPDDTPLPIKLQIINAYVNGTPVEEIAPLHDWSVPSVRRAINKFYGSLKDIMETEILMESHELDLMETGSKKEAEKRLTLYHRQKKIDEDINASFLAKLSPEHEQILTEEERLFCYLLVHEGDEMKALEDAGLAEGIKKGSPSKKRALKLRCLMLKGKVNLIRYIRDLQTSYSKDLNVTKDTFQSELYQQIRQLKSLDDPKLAPTIAKLTEQLGRTIGAFTDRVEIHEVSFDDAMDEMLEMRKAQEKKFTETKDIPLTEETYVYDPESIG